MHHRHPHLNMQKRMRTTSPPLASSCSLCRASRLPVRQHACARMCKRVSTVAAKELVESFTTSATCTRSVQKASGHYLMAVWRFRGTFLLPAAIQPLPGFRLKSTLDDSKHSPPNQARLRSKCQPGSVLSTPLLPPRNSRTDFISLLHFSTMLDPRRFVCLVCRISPL